MPLAPADTEPLYAAAPEAFVEERKRLARALREAGRRDDAKTVEKLTRPTVSVWAVNQLARREATQVKELGALADRLREAHASGGGEYAEAAAAHRSVLAALRAAAEALLAGGGHATSPQLLARIMTNLRAGVASPELRPLIDGGRLDHDIEETGFGGLLDVPLVVGPPAPPRSPAAPRAPAPAGTTPRTGATATPAAEQRREREVAERARAQARALAKRRVSELVSELGAARKTIEREVRAAGAAREALAEADRRVDAARVHEAELDDALAAAKRALTDLD